MKAMNDIKNVLIVDDEDSPAGELKELFEDNSKWQLFDKIKTIAYPNLTFKVTLCSNPFNLHQFFQDQTPPWDIIVIDRSFEIGNQIVVMDLSVLAALRDLAVPGIRIVWTGHAELPPERIGMGVIDSQVPDIVQCMRLGAWDYLDKAKPRYSCTCEDVVVSAIQGLLNIQKETDRRKTNYDASEHVQKCFSDLFPIYSGKFVAFEKGLDEKWQPIADSEDLFTLYGKQRLSKTDSSRIHITYFRSAQSVVKFR